MTDMKHAKKLYRQAHGASTVCPTCRGEEEYRAARAYLGRPCCGNGTVLRYPPAAPGLRAFARGEFKGNACTGKLARVLGGP